MHSINKIVLSLFVFSLSTLFPLHLQAANPNPFTSTSTTTASVGTTLPTTGDIIAPTNPILIRPIDGTVTGDNKLEFIWKQSLDPNGNVVTYTLYLNGVATYLGISNIGNSSGNNYTSRLDGTEIRLTPKTPLLDGNYNWYVTAEDQSGNRSHSTTWNLTIDTTPPHILVSDIDIYHDLLLDSDLPENFVDVNYEIAGPKEVYLTISAESWSTVTIQLYDADNLPVGQSTWPVGSSGIIYPHIYLDLGSYRVTISAYDHGGNTTVLPDITLTVSQAQITISLPTIPDSSPEPGKSPTPIISIPYTPINIPSLPATIANIESRVSLPYLISILLAIGIIILLILVWRKKYNLVLLDSVSHPIKTATIYHSIPTKRSKYSPVLVTGMAPISYTIRDGDKGLLYIPNLSRYSTLTIRTADATYILSLSIKQRLYTILLG